jgi:hypothetical protein
VNCRDRIWCAISSPLLVMLLFGCDYGERNKNPIAQEDTAITARGVAVTIDVLANDSDPDGDPINLIAWTQGGGGEVIRDGARTLTYIPLDGFDGSDSYTYTIDDEHGGRATGRVTVTVLPDPGVVVDGTLYTVRTFIPRGFLGAAAWGINESGQVAGAGLAEDETEVPFFLDTNGAVSVIPVPSLPGRASGVNNNGVVSGRFFMPVDHDETSAVAMVVHENDHDHDHDHDHEDDHDHDHGDDHDHGEADLFGRSFLWDAKAQTLVAIYQIIGASATLGSKINDVGQVVGQVQFPVLEGEGDDEEHEHEEHGSMMLGFIRQPDGTTSTFAVPGAAATMPSGINNRGQIVGSFTAADGSGRPRTGFLHHADGTYSAFNVLDAQGSPLPTHAESINDLGFIVGFFTLGAHDHEHDDEHAHGADDEPEGAGEGAQPFLRKPDGTIFRFALPNTAHARFLGLNNQNIIGGVGIDENSFHQALILTPTPPAPNTFFRDTPVDGEDQGHDHDH